MRNDPDHAPITSARAIIDGNADANLFSATVEYTFDSPNMLANQHSLLPLSDLGYIVWTRTGLGYPLRGSCGPSVPLPP